MDSKILLNVAQLEGAMLAGEVIVISEYKTGTGNRQVVLRIKGCWYIETEEREDEKQVFVPYDPLKHPHIDAVWLRPKFVEDFIEAIINLSEGYGLSLGIEKGRFLITKYQKIKSDQLRYAHDLIV